MVDKRKVNCEDRTHKDNLLKRDMKIPPKNKLLELTNEELVLIILELQEEIERLRAEIAKTKKSRPSQ